MNITYDQIQLLNELLKLTGCSHSREIFSAKLNFDKFIQYTQEHWLRPSHTERWDLVDSDLLILNREKILKILSALGFINEIKPRRKQYDCVLVLGSSHEPLLDRIKYLETIWHYSVRFEEIYFLTGDIPLAQRNVELMKDYGILTANNMVMTDTDLTKIAYEKISAHWSVKLREIKVEVFPTPSTDPINRSNTKDTVIAWVTKYKCKTNILLISNQPFVFYQDIVALSVLRQEQQADIAGPKAVADIKISVVLDTMARYFYEKYRE